MPAWEYRKIHLNDGSPKIDEIDVLNEVGSEGWELVGITSNSVAYLKRQIEQPPLTQAEQSSARSTRRRAATPVK